MASLDRPTLEGKFVRLEPLVEAHRAEYEALGPELDGAEWQYNVGHDTGPFARWFEVWFPSSLAMTSDQAVVFAVRRSSDRKIVGSTRYLSIDLPNKSLEIGSTWYAPGARGGSVNPECKFLLLRHGFETLDLNRIQLKCDALNARSRAAMLKFGAKEEGTLRSQSIYKSGRVRDTTFFSVIRQEWPEVKRGLEERLARFA